MPATDNYTTTGTAGPKVPHIQDPASRAFAITKSDTVDCSEVTRAVYVGGAGDLTVVMAGGGAAVTFVGVPAGTLLPIRISRLKSTGTDATDVLGLA